MSEVYGYSTTTNVTGIRPLTTTGYGAKTNITTPSGNDYYQPYHYEPNKIIPWSEKANPFQGFPKIDPDAFKIRPYQRDDSKDKKIEELEQEVEDLKKQINRDKKKKPEPAPEEPKGDVNMDEIRKRIWEGATQCKAKYSVGGVRWGRT